CWACQSSIQSHQNRCSTSSCFCSPRVPSLDCPSPIRMRADYPPTILCTRQPVLFAALQPCAKPPLRLLTREGAPTSVSSVLWGHLHERIVDRDRTGSTAETRLCCNRLNGSVTGLHRDFIALVDNSQHKQPSAPSTTALCCPTFILGLGRVFG